MPVLGKEALGHITETLAENGASWLQCDFLRAIFNGLMNNK